MTNAERIRQMTDEELAAWLAPRMLCSDCPLCATDENLMACFNMDCTKSALEYLQEVSEDVNKTD